MYDQQKTLAFGLEIDNLIIIQMLENAVNI